MEFISPNNRKPMDLESSKEMMTIKKAQTTALASKMKKKAQPKAGGFKLKKAPGAPRRFKTAFIFFSTQKHKEFREAMGTRGSRKVKATNIAKMVSKAWKNLSKEERAVWDEIAAKDKARYELERSTYRGPWQVVDTGRDPLAPRRPCSAFINFLNFKRDEVKKEHPTATSVEVMRITAQLWRENAPERELFEARAMKDRENYRQEMEQWKAMQQRKPEALMAAKREEMAWSALEEAEDSQHQEGQQEGFTDEEEQLIATVSKRATPKATRGKNQRALRAAKSSSAPLAKRLPNPNLSLSCIGNEALSRMRTSSASSSSRFNQMTNKLNLAHPILVSSQEELAASERILQLHTLLQQQKDSGRLLRMSTDPLMMMATGTPMTLAPALGPSLSTTPAIHRELTFLLEGLRRERQLLALERLERHL